MKLVKIDYAPTVLLKRLKAHAIRPVVPGCLFHQSLKSALPPPQLC